MANVFHFTFMKTFLVLEIDSVIDIEDDLFWQCYKCATCAQPITRAGTNTPSDEYDTYREYRVANTIRITNTLFLRG